MEDFGETEAFTYADYYTVIPQIQKYYYTMLELFRRYSEMKKFGKSNKKLKVRIQTIVETLAYLLKNYKSIKDSKENILFKNYEKDREETAKITTVLLLINKFTISFKIMSDETLSSCVDGIVKAHFVLGLSAIEKPREDGNYLQKKFAESYG